MMELQSHVSWDTNVPFQPPSAQYNFTASTGETGEPNVVVGFAQPFKIIHASQEWLDLFRFSREEVAERSIQIIQGPGTDFDTIKAMISSQEEGKSKEATLMIYSSACQGRLMRVKSAPAVNNGQVSGCLLTMHQTDAVPYKVAYSEDGTAKALVGLKEPHIIEWTSTPFNGLYGFEAGQLEGRTLRVLLGPNTDHRRWDEVFNGCGSGESCSCNFVTCRHDCVELEMLVQVSPVFSSNGISHLLATFAPASSAITSSAPNKAGAEDTSHVSHAPLEEGFRPPRAQLRGSNLVRPQSIQALAQDQPLATGLPTQRFQPSQLASLSSPVTALASDQGASAFTFPAGGSVVTHQTSAPTVFGGLLVPAGASMPAPVSLQHSNLAEFFGLAQPAGRSAEAEKVDTESKVFPRRKQGHGDGEDGARGPVVITLEVLERFADLSLTAAAAKLGISPTAVKKACRKLGVLRWPYRKNQEQAPDSSVAHYDEAYVRKLYRKYSKSAKAMAAAKDTASGAGAPGPAVVQVQAGSVEVAQLHHQAEAAAGNDHRSPMVQVDGHAGSGSRGPGAAASGSLNPHRGQGQVDAPLAQAASHSGAPGGSLDLGTKRDGALYDGFGRMGVDNSHKALAHDAVHGGHQGTLPGITMLPTKSGHVTDGPSLQLAAGNYVGGVQGGGSGYMEEEGQQQTWNDLSLGLNQWGT